jgi:hypothetical protein
MRGVSFKIEFCLTLNVIENKWCYRFFERVFNERLRLQVYENRQVIAIVEKEWRKKGDHKNQGYP